MRFVPKIPVGLGNDPLIQFLNGVVTNLLSLTENQCYTLEKVWSVPFDLQIPLASRVRKTPPDIVRLGRAQEVSNFNTPVNYGPVTWRWNGDGSVKIMDVQGLTAGTKYRLVFEAVG